MKIKKADQVKVLSGKDRGKKGKVLRCLPEIGKIVVEKVNVVKKHQKPKRQSEKGERISLPMPINISNVQLICPKCNKPTRIGYKKLEKGKKTRVCKKCQVEID